ncbi:hydroxymethylpyrimidine/phosphomethylpyrimidine kinase, partial [bacterium]|nr:hydroxymethylpyrimidine/phosphomethylpyrimidine kinase [bacterium]
MTVETGQVTGDVQPCALTIAGSDSGAGAGIQADLKTFAALGVFSTSVLTVITAQNTLGVDAVHQLPPEFVLRQLESVYADFSVAAVKTGALGTVEVIEAVSGFLSSHSAKNLVVDPVIISKHGHRLLAEDAVETLGSRLIPLAAVVTPNLHEAAALTGRARIEDIDTSELGRRLDSGEVAVVAGFQGVGPRNRVT